ncbi:hypothetical protein C8A00DRAFT_33718 [Chaetomidium leptoderma]|uniref:Uncharacterized protein n=1 Tax=Chaetomidium leptoderma TaxID=669021 RepID=A0AAN6VL36_9PEZI|nr:hypothetical protein C8A00DRAFT_33718 [Chaetomidium leptoderma]
MDSKTGGSSWPWGGRKRRNSESSVLSLRELVTGRRNSLSAADGTTTEPNVLRKKPPQSAIPKPKKPQAADDKKPDEKVAAAAAAAPTAATTAATATAAADSSDARKSQSRPPPAFFNKVKHRHTFSASAVLRWYTINNDDDVLLKPPHTRSRNSSSAGPPPGLKPTAAPPTLRPPRSRVDGPLAMYPTEEKEFVLRTQRASARMQHITGSQPGPKGPDLEHAPMIHMPTASPDGSLPGPERPGGYNKPRRLSNSSSTSSVTSSVVSGRDSVDGRIRTASFSSSQTSIDTSPVTWQTQNGAASQNYPWHRPAPVKYRRKARPGELFAALPGEVLELILDELRKLHLQPKSSSCATCWMRDCCSVAVSARKFLKYAREALYQHVQLVGHEGPAMKKRTKTSYGSRLVLLRRTLRSNPQIAVIVRSLKPPARPLSVGVVPYNDLVASVVMACPNFERLAGFYPTYDHSFQRLFQALSTRPKLKEMDWILEPSAAQRLQRTRSNNDRWGPGDLQPQESQLFMGFHANWRQLTTLVVHCQPGASLSPANLLECTIRSLPSLQNLHLSHVPHTAFSDTNLLSLPALKKLSLSYCTGVTTAGLSSLATRPASASLQALTLTHMNVESLPAIARIFSYLVSLSTFTLVQTYAPEMPPDEFIMLFPYLASPSLHHLHWDIPYLPNTSTPADAILARSIAAGGFPALRSLCAPNDPEGLFQALCIPRERVDHPTDRYRRAAAPTTAATAATNGGAPWTAHHTRNNSSFSSTRTGGSFSQKNTFGSSNNNSNGTPPASPLFPPPPPPDAALLAPRDNSNLHQARLAAQKRLEAAQRCPRFFVNVVDERGSVVEKFAVGAFLGSVESKVRYVLFSSEQEGGGTDEGGGVVGVEDLMIRGDGGEMIAEEGGGKKTGTWKGGGREREAESDAEGAVRGRKEGCCGRWNTYSGVVVDKKDRERWWHQERGRWKGGVLS